jgi:hypothetical protein
MVMQGDGHARKTSYSGFSKQIGFCEIRDTGLADERLVWQLDSAARVLARHGMRAELEQRVTLVEGVWCSVTYQFRLPVSDELIGEFNDELVIEEIEVETLFENAFGVRFEKART